MMIECRRDDWAKQRNHSQNHISAPNDQQLLQSHSSLLLKKKFFRRNSSDRRDFWFVWISAAGLFEQAVKQISRTKIAYKSNDTMTLNYTLWRPKWSASTLASGHFSSDRRDFFFVQISSAGKFERAVKLISRPKIAYKSRNAMTLKWTLCPPKWSADTLVSGHFSSDRRDFFFIQYGLARDDF